MKSLQLYTASAGAGKTYRLALSYIHQLFEFPDAYRRILAVTFTNKAAAEMKKRILEKLSQLSNEDPEAEDYANYLLKNHLAKDKPEIKDRARTLLVNILHDYSAFYVQTIDRFFQWVIRGFTREIGLQNGYNLELDNLAVLSEAVDMLIFSMEEDPQLKTWLIEFAEEKISEGKSWDFSADVFQLGLEVFKENYQLVSDEISDVKKRKERFNQLRAKINKTIFSIENEIRKRGAEGIQIIHSAGLEFSDFKYGSTAVVNLFQKAVNNPVRDLKISNRNREGVGDFNLWVKDGSPKLELIRDLYEPLNQLLSEILDIYDSRRTEYITAFLLKKNIYSFGILNDISDRIREISKDKNLFLLSDSSLFLKKIIGENDAPFIFEKAGNYFSNYMLDEFQDTSRFQWDNFLPLIENGLASGNTSIIVGDVKQSIYRWRNSDWKILASELKKQISPSRITDIQLDWNFRSSEEVVSFNNTIFYRAPSILKDIIRDKLAGRDLPGIEDDWVSLINKVYGEPRQKIAISGKMHKGYVCQDFSEYMNKTDALEIIRNWIPEKVKDLQDRGFNAGDITFLVRTAKEGRDIARILMEEGNKTNQPYNFSVISNDSLYLGNNSAVKFLVALLKFFNQSYDKLNTSFIKHEYLAYLSENKNSLDNWHSVFSESTFNLFSIDQDICFKNFSENLENLHRLPLYELVERLIQVFRLNNGEERVAYIQAFQDRVLEFIRKDSSDISSFLDYWNASGSSSTLNVSETQDALRIMTIHKAKGLEFKVVVIPFCDWYLYPDTRGFRNITLWPDTTKAGYGEFTHLPVMYTKQMENSIFSEEYFEEMFRTFVDNLNLLYVAVTRAELELHSFSVLSEKPENISNMGDLLWEIMKNPGQSESQTNYQMANISSGFNLTKKLFRLGIPLPKPVGGSMEKGVHTEVLKGYPVTSKMNLLNLNHKNIYLSDLKEDEKGKTGYGMQMHEIFAEIDKKEDIEKALRNAWLKGLLSSKDREELFREIKDKLSLAPFDDWYSGRWETKIELDLTAGDGSILRPDRVMLKDGETLILDYKFGKEKKKVYIRQLQEYGTALKKSGYQNIKMFLWYYNLEELEEVKT